MSSHQLLRVLGYNESEGNRITEITNRIICKERRRETKEQEVGEVEVIKITLRGNKEVRVFNIPLREVLPFL